MCNVTRLQILAAVLLLAGLRTAAADPAEAEALMGAWCDDTGYRLDLGPDSITFFDAQAPHPPPGLELAFAPGMAVYAQDFRNTSWPELDVVACTLRLTAPGKAEETCTGPGTGFRPRIALERCPVTPIS